MFKSIPTLAEVKGIRKPKGRIRLTGNECEKAKEFQSDFILEKLSYQGTISLHLDDRAFFRCGISLSVYTLGDPLF